MYNKNYSMLFSLKLFVAAGLVSNSMSEVVLFEAEMVNRFGISTIQRDFINVILVKLLFYH